MLHNGEENKDCAVHGLLQAESILMVFEQDLECKSCKEFCIYHKEGKGYIPR
jgi:hypothetical protein